MRALSSSSSSSLATTLMIAFSSIILTIVPYNDYSVSSFSFVLPRLTIASKESFLTHKFAIGRHRPIVINSRFRLYSFPPQPPSAPPPESIFEENDKNEGTSQEGTIEEEDGYDDDDDLALKVADLDPEEILDFLELNNTVAILRDESLEAVRRAEIAELRVAELKEEMERTELELEEKERLLKEGGDFWAEEKAKMAYRIAEFTKLLQQKDANLTSATKIVREDAEQKQAELQRNLSTLQTELEQAETKLNELRQGSEQLKSRLQDAEDKLEFEQMRFEKEKAEMNDRIQEERTKLANVEDKFAKEQEKFQSDRKELKQRISQESLKLNETKTQLKADTEQFQKAKTALEQTIEKQKTKILSTEQELSTERSQFWRERTALESALQEERTKLSKSETALQSETERFDNIKSDLERKIATEQQRLNDASIKLEQELNRFLAEKSDLEIKIQSEQEKFSALEVQLDDERLENQKTVSNLEQAVEDGIRVRKLKARQMKRRFNAIREEMTGMLVRAKSDARREQKRLKDRYETALTKRDKAMSGLEEQLANANLAAVEANRQLEEMTRRKDSLENDVRDMDVQFIKKLAERNEVITSLRTDITGLKDVLAQREQTIAQYESSYRSLAALTLRLTGKKLRKGGARIKNIIVKNKENSDDEI